MENPHITLGVYARLWRYKRYFALQAKAPLFHDDEGRQGSVAALRALGRNPEGLESEGFYHAEVRHSRPRGDPGQTISEMRLAAR